jgi:hypothetical protein
MRCIILPLILLVAVACQPGVGPLTDEDVAALRDLGQTYVRGFSANDAGTVAAVYAEGAVEMPPNIPARDGVYRPETGWMPSGQPMRPISKPARKLLSSR